MADGSADNFTTDTDNSDDSDSNSISDVESQSDEEMQINTPSQTCQKDGSVCALCAKEYLAGDLVYESNNAQCGHQFHKVCMDKWLNIQNTCPICNQPFVLQSV